MQASSGSEPGDKAIPLWLGGRRTKKTVPKVFISLSMSTLLPLGCTISFAYNEVPEV